MQNQNIPIQNREVCTSLICKVGQEAVQEIVSKTTDVMQLIKSMQTNQSNNQLTNNEEKKNRLKNELLKSISFNFKRLYKIYEKCMETNLSIEDIEPENLIPIEGKELNIKRTPNETIKEHQKEYNELIKILKSKNLKIKEIIDNLRDIVWSINTMLSTAQNK